MATGCENIELPLNTTAQKIAPYGHMKNASKLTHLCYFFGQYGCFTCVDWFNDDNKCIEVTIGCENIE